MKKTWFYPFIAGLYDFYCVALLLGTIVALGVSIVRTPINILIGFIILLLSIGVPVIYHALLAKRFQYLSPGEIIAGRIIENNQKVWFNPYKYNRWALFLVIALDLLIIGNSWDGLSESYVYSIREVVVRGLIIVLVLYGLIELGRGRARGVIYPILYLVLQVLQAANVSVPTANRTALQFIAMLMIAIVLLNLVIVFLYSFLRNRHSSQVMHPSR